jgi:cytochrome c-type biogenesis protein CcmH
MTPEQRASMIRGMVDALAARLKDNPDDLEGWLRLGRSYTVLGERGLAADAYKRAAALAPGRADVLSALLAQLDPQSPDHAEVRRRLDALKQGG